MGVIQIVKEADNEEFLRKKSRVVTEITPRIITLLDDMIDTMHAADGVGLAAPQVGVLRRIGNRSFNVCYNVICTVEKIEDRSCYFGCNLL